MKKLIITLNILLILFITGCTNTSGSTQTISLTNANKLSNIYYYIINSAGELYYYLNVIRDKNNNAKHMLTFTDPSTSDYLGNTIYLPTDSYSWTLLDFS